MTSLTAPGKNDPKTIFGWCMYDWANSAYVTTVAVALLPAYFAQVVVGPQGVAIGGTTYSATSLWGFAVSGATFIAFLFAPVLGSIADFSRAKKRFLLAFAYSGSLFTLLLFFSRSGDVFKTLLLFLVAEVGFVSANVFYDAFLPQISSEDKIDWISGKGYAFGYIGGGLQFAISLGLAAGHRTLGISQDLAMRVSLAMAGLWWAGFTLFTARYLTEAPATEKLPERYHGWPRPVAFGAVGLTRTFKTLRRVGRFRHLVLFLVAFMLYNDGIQTVINMASVYAIDELRLSTTAVMLTLLIIQVIATPGALLFGRIASAIGSKHAVMVTLVLWSAVVVLAYFIHTSRDFFLLGAAVGLVLGGSQALSRSFYGSMVPEQASAEFYGFYTIFSKFSAMWGPMAFAIIRQMTGTSRLSIVSLIVFFIVGLALLHFVDEQKAREAKLAGAF
jgi:UMF1 family MFS transporter